MKFDYPYNRKDFKEFLHKFLTDGFYWDTSVLRPDLYSQAKRRKIKEGFILGHDDNLGITVYEFHHDSQYDPRVTLSREAFTIMANRGERRALAVFISKNSPNYRLSLLTIDLTFDETRKDLKKVYSNPKRFSFLLGPNAKVGTPTRYLREKVKDFDDLKKRFSVEVVNKEFYRAIAEHFKMLVSDDGKVGMLKLPSTPISNVEIYKNFAVRLIGRIIFLWFLKEKKSKNGVPLIPEELLSRKAVENNENYYHMILEPLFFEVLNTPLEKRQKRYQNEPYNKIPFLNGGLFSPKMHDFYEFSETTGLSKHLNTLKISDEWFLNLFNVLETYNFTIDENTPIDVELSVDPEMLGRIFENLLAELNPETEENARRATGSYYTPREIVDYMVNESLKYYLMEKTGIPEIEVEKLLSYTEDVEIPEEMKDRILDAIYNMKILDPACGSGAFPMGILQKAVWILDKIDPNAEKWKEKILESISDPITRRIVKERLDKETVQYIRKLKIVENCIYGVDIQEIAVELAKLRVFLSLIVDANIDDNKENRGVEPLPNLDFKFVSADSLLKLHETNMLLGTTQEKIDQLKRIREEYFTVSTLKGKEDLQKQFRNLQNEIGIDLIGWVSAHKRKNIESVAYKLSTWDPFGDKPANWFDPFWMFGLEDKFDIVIGNPPYIQLQKNGGKLANLYKDVGYETFSRMGDIYALFYERGIELLKPEGILAFITSNKWMRAGYGEKLRKFFIKYNPLVLVDLGPGVFENATVDTSILIIQKAQNKKQLRGCTLPDKSVEIARFVRENSVLLDGLSSGAWYIGTPVEHRLREKIESIGKPLKDWDIKIFYGIKTGLNKAFIIDEKKRLEILNNCRDEEERKRTEAIIKPILRGQDIRRYAYKWAGLYVIVIPAGWTNENKGNQDPEEFFKEQYSAVYKHLREIGNAIESGQLKVKGKGLYNRDDQGDYWWELRPCDYYEEFEKEKVVWGNISDRSTFTFVEKGIYVTAPANILVTRHTSVKYLYGVMNSKIFEWEFKQVGIFLGHAFEWKKQYVEQVHIPVPASQIEISTASHIECVVDKIIIIKSTNPDADTTDLECEIDFLVYQLYDLTPKEIEIIEKSVSKE